MLTVGDVIELALPSGTKIAAGKAGLDREVTWASRIRPTPPAFAHLTGGELVLLPDGVLDQLDERLTIDGAVHQLAGFNVAAIVLSTAPSKAAKDAAEETGLPLLLLPKGTDQGPLEREAARLITERRRDVQRRGQEVFRRLMELAIAGEPLAGVVRALAELSNRAVILEGRDGRLLAYQVGSGQGPDREAVEDLLLQDRPQLVRWLRTTTTSSAAEPPTTTHALDPQWGRVISPVIGRDGLLGSISLVFPQVAPSPDDAEATARGAAACAVVLAREQAAATARREVELHVLDEVLDGALRSESTLLQQARRLGHDLNAAHVAIVARFDQASTAPVRAGGKDDRWDVLGEALSRIGGARGVRPLWRIRSNVAEIIWPVGTDADPTAIAADLQDGLAAMVGSKTTLVSIGLGSIRDGIAGIRRSHQEAKHALVLGRRMNGPGLVTPFANLGVFRLIYAAENLPELHALYEETLGTLIAYDRANNADLISTLAAFFAANGSPKEAAERLKVHRNTVLYRLDRIRDITEYDLEDADLRLRLHLALCIHQALGSTSDTL